MEYINILCVSFFVEKLFYYVQNFIGYCLIEDIFVVFLVKLVEIYMGFLMEGIKFREGEIILLDVIYFLCKIEIVK